MIFLRSCSTLALCVLTSACAVKRAIILNPAALPSAASRVAVVPVADWRIDRSEDLDLNELRERASKALKGRHFSVNPVEESLSARQVRNPDAEFYTRICAPRNASDAVFLVAVRDARAKLTFGSTANVVVVGYLWNCESRSVAWKGVGMGRVGQGGLIGMALSGLMLGDAVAASIKDMFASLPNAK